MQNVGKQPSVFDWLNELLDIRKDKTPEGFQ